MLNTLSPADSLYYEITFYLSECLIVKDKFVEAEEVLKMLVNRPNIPSDVIQKSLVRLGQIYCVVSRPAEANKVFTKLKTDFPRSKYIPLANCESVLDK